MNILGDLGPAAMAALPALLVPLVVMIPFAAAEQIWPARERPSWRDYGFNILISATAVYLALPAGMLAGSASRAVLSNVPWRPLEFPFEAISAVPVLGGLLKVLALTFLPLIVHDMWFYWSHRIEHRIPALWEFHKLHHSDELLNCSTWARDHFLQNAWRAFFSVFTLGLAIDLDAMQAGEAAMFSGLFLMCQSMLYHSAIRLRMPWLDRVLVTPQVHRIHHSIDPSHYNRNFADVFPLFDILFGTFQKPNPDEFPATGLPGRELSARSLLPALASPAIRGLRRLVRPGT